jgi:nuclear pore complex protein Nup205
MDTIHRLRTALAAFESGAGAADYDNRQLFNELIAHKSRLIQLFDVGARNAQEQREIESGAP